MTERMMRKFALFTLLVGGLILGQTQTVSAVEIISTFGDASHSIPAGAWTDHNTGLNEHFESTPGGNNTSKWDFSGVADGNYYVFANWTPAGNRTNIAEYSYSTGGSTPNVNQINFTADATFGGSNWQRLTAAPINIIGGNFSVTASDAGAGFLMADSILISNDFTPIAPVVPSPPIIAFGDVDHSSTGAWSDNGALGHNGTEAFQSSFANGATSTYSYHDIAPGDYYVSASWTPVSNRTPHAQYNISNGGGMVVVNQKSAVRTFTDSGTDWLLLTPTPVTVGASGTLTVTLSDDETGDTATDFLMADAIHITTTDPTPPPVIDLPNPVNILNPSFEDQAAALPSDGNFLGADVTEWKDQFPTTAAAGVFNPVSPDVAADGDIVLFLNGGGYLVQDLEFAGGIPLTAQPGEQITVKFQARMSTGAAGSVSVGIRGPLNGLVEVDGSGTAIAVPASPGYTELGLTFTILDSASLGALEGQPINLVFDSAVGGQVWVDSVSATTSMPVPEPASCILAILGFAIVGLVVRKSRKNKAA